MSCEWERRSSPHSELSFLCVWENGRTSDRNGDSGREGNKEREQALPELNLSCWQSSQKEMPIGNLKPKLNLRPRNKELG